MVYNVSYSTFLKNLMHRKRRAREIPKEGNNLKKNAISLQRSTGRTSHCMLLKKCTGKKQTRNS